MPSAIIEISSMLVKSRAAAAVLVDRICAASRAENRAAGERLAAIGGLELLGLGEFGDCDDWSTDTQEAVTAEVAAALRISQGLAASYRYYSRAMRNRRPGWGRYWWPVPSTIGCFRRSSTAPM